MPEMEGAMFVGQINAHAELSNSRIVMLTSMARYGDMSRFTELGLAGYLSKPVRARELFKCLDRVLAHESREWRSQNQPVVTRNVLEEHRAAQRFHGKVLLVEDNSVNQKVAQRFLERLGCSVVVADNGELGVRAYLSDSFDLVLMDLQMPVMDGFTATRRIRDAEGWRARTPIIALTANAMTGQLERCLAAGMDGFLTKPLDVARLRDTLEEFGLADDDSGLDDAAAEELVSTANVKPAIDLAKLYEVTQGDEEFKRELIDAFVQTGEQILAEFDSAMRTQDRDRISRLAHKLKGAAANMYAETVRDASADLELHATEWADAALQEHLKRLSAAVRHAIASLRELAAGEERQRSAS
jgi:CheY-like chemotaxis protein